MLQRLEGIARERGLDFIEERLSPHRPQMASKAEELGFVLHSEIGGKLVYRKHLK